jgi:formate dehydrogenase major subunit
MPVAQPSEWQKKYSRFTDQQLKLLNGEHTGTDQKLTVSGA